MPLHSLWIQLEQTPQKMELVPTPSRHTPQGSLPDFWSTSNPGPNIRILMLPMLTRNPFPSMLVFQRISFCCNSSNDSVMMARSSAYRFSQGHPVRNSWERVPEPWWKVRGSSKSLGERPLSHWTLYSGCNQHAFCFWRFHTCSVCPAPATHQRLACEESTRWHVWVHGRIPFPDRQRPCTVTYLWHKTFLATGVQ